MAIFFFIIPKNSWTPRAALAARGLRHAAVLLLAVTVLAMPLASACEAATIGSAVQRLADAAVAESSLLLGLLGLFVALGLVLAIDRRRRLRTPRSNT